MLIFGITGYQKILGVMMALCGRCHNQATHHIVKHGSKFSLFFIPLLPLSSRYAVVCSICGQQRPLSRAEAESLASSPEAPAAPAAPAPQFPAYDPQQQSGVQDPGNEGHNPWGAPGPRR